jgi:outer membrane protein OmpA-like peptidoglycan-associated protein
MRATVMVVLAMFGGVASLAAQHGHNYEFGLFGSFTRYSTSFQLPNKVGGGVRLGYMFGDLVETELELLFPSEYKVGTTASRIDPVIGGGSIILNVLHGERNILYVLGGYSRLDFGNTAPYRFTDNGVHGALGDRIFLSHNMALRLEGRAIYSPDTQSSFGMKSVTHFVGTVGLAIMAPGQKRRAAPPPPAPPAAVPNAPPLPTPPLLVQDADQDGVPDKDDACPTTPVGAKVDARGCSLDSDHDGVPDGLDKCPDTPAGATVDATGCPADSDRDAVPDGLDKCPNTPAGTPVDAVGCPLAQDSDHDGVPDAADKCPDTPRGVPVDSTGCMILFQPEAAPKAQPGAPAPRPTLILRGVNFKSGLSVLTTESYAVLDQVAASLMANPEIKIEVAGYTDNTGPIGVNLRLSQARAAAVRAYLARKGVSPSRMVARGYGSRSPVASNTTPAGRAQNRRVELHKL